VLERHVDHCVQNIVVFANAVWVQPTGEQIVPVLGDMNMAQFIDMA
jgi:hypothetical protein